jgi:hypothetical protein
VQVVNAARDHVHALSCGLTTRERERRALAVLRAYVDDSGSSGRDGFYVMAGIVAPTFVWDDFVDPWAEILNSGVPVPFFRQANFRDPEWRKAHGISKEQAEAKTNQLANAIKYPPLLFSVCCSVSKQQYREAITDPQLWRNAGRIGKLWLKTPYAFCFHQMIGLTLRQMVNYLGLAGEVVDFVFDRNEPLFDAANVMLRELRPTLQPKGWSEALGDAIPGNDEKVIPLQSADLVAGRLKDHCSTPKNKDIYKSLVGVTGIGNNNITWHTRPHTLRDLATGLRSGKAKFLLT